MKTTIHYIFLAIICSFSLKSQEYNEPEPENMKFIPAGSCFMKIDDRNIHVSVGAFWMSNEITNKEYREYVDYVINHPDEEICIIDFSALKIKLDQAVNITEEEIKKHTNCVKYSEIIHDIIDSAALSRGFNGLEDIENQFKNYFTDKEFNNYPVVGVPFRHAQFYCRWRTDMENKKLRARGLPPIHDYRIPLDTEWSYVASMSDTNNHIDCEKIFLLQEVDKGEKNDYNLTNFSGNVSEWVIDANGLFRCEKNLKDLGIYSKNILIRGGWYINRIFNPDYRSCSEEGMAKGHVGFRIVRSYTGIQITGM